VLRAEALSIMNDSALIFQHLLIFSNYTANSRRRDEHRSHKMSFIAMGWEKRVGMGMGGEGVGLVGWNEMVKGGSWVEGVSVEGIIGCEGEDISYRAKMP